MTFKAGQDVCWVDDRAPHALEVRDAVVTEVTPRGTVRSTIVAPDSAAGVSRSFMCSPECGPEFISGRFVLVTRDDGNALRNGVLARKP